MRLRRSAYWKRSALLAVVLVPGVPGAGAAQEPVREVQVPMDADGRVLEVTPELRSGTNLFPGVSNFEAARLFRRQDGTLVLEVSWREDSLLTRERSVLSPGAVQSLRQEVTIALDTSELSLPVSVAGRGGLIWRTTALGLGFYGWSVPIAANIQNERLAVATYLLTAASSFYLPYRLTRDRPVTDAHRSLTIWGATRGALYGGTLGFGVTDRGGPPGTEDDDRQWRVRLALGTIGSVTGGVLGFKAVDRTGIDQGTAELRGMLTDFATAAGFGTAYVLGLYDDEVIPGPDGFPVRDDPDLLAGNLLALTFAGAGLLGGSAVGARNEYSVGDAHVLRSFGLMGAQALLPIANLVDEDENKVHVAAAILGTTPALFLGNRELSRQSFSSSDGILVAAGHLAGGLVGAGLTYLANPDSDRDALIYLTTTALGSAAGLVLTYRALATGRNSSDSAGRIGDRRRGREGVEVLVNPAALLPASPRIGRPVAPSGPVLTIRW